MQTFRTSHFRSYVGLTVAFPARYEEFRREHRFDVNLLERLGADDLGGAEDELHRLNQELKDMQWWPTADIPPLEIMFLEG